MKVKTVQIEPIEKRNHFLEARLLSRDEVTAAIQQVLKQIRCNMEYFKTRFPTSAAKDGTYGIIDSIEWTDGFWTGMLWLAYEYSGDSSFKELAEKNVESFLHRVKERIELDHHDLGFLYSLSCVSSYKLTGFEKGKEAGLLAADKLMERYRENHGFIQAWGELGARNDYRLIIDCMLNIPLLYWAYGITGDKKYYEAANRHFETTCQYVIRDDASAYHTFYFDPETGEPLKGVTRQGYSDSSSWARGQAWGIYGIPLNYRNVKDPKLFGLFKGMTNYFLNRLPEDDICYWDLIFGDGSGHSRDSSAAAVAVCGIHEMLKYLPETEEEKGVYRYAMHGILRSLIENYTNSEVKAGNPVLLHGVYSWHSGKGVDEGNIWGDYFYLEALIRFYKDWDLYW